MVPDFKELTKIEMRALEDQLKSVRQVLSHAGEKGRVLEGYIIAFLRKILPSEYGIGTGFIAYHGPKGTKLSSQIDIIIYDAIRCAPIVKFETCDVFPLESVYAYIEVKACLRSSPKKEPVDSIEYCIKRSADLARYL